MTEQVVDQSVEARQAFLEAQAAIGNVAKKSLNPAFKSKYVDLATLNEAVIPELNKRGLFLTQYVNTVGGNPTVTTKVQHTNGYVIEYSTYPIISKDNADPQKFGGGLTYARRYSIMAMLGIAGEDDDGNKASQPAAAPKTTPLDLAIETLKGRLKAQGVTPETLPTVFKDRFNDSRKTAFSHLTATEVNAWLADIDEGVPF